MVDYTSWFSWNFSLILFWATVGLMVWLASQTKELKTKIKSPLLVGFAASLIGAFEIGLTAIISSSLYFLFLHIFRYWYFKLKGKTIESTINESSLKVEIEEDEEKKPVVMESVKVEEVVVEPEVVKVEPKPKTKRNSTKVN